MSREMGWPGVAHRDPLLNCVEVQQTEPTRCLSGKLKQGLWASMGLLSLTVESGVTTSSLGQDLGDHQDGHWLS